MFKLILTSIFLFLLPIQLLAEDASKALNISILQKPIPVPTEKGNYLVYELQMVNQSEEDLQLGLIDINDQNGKPIKSYFGVKLKDNIVFYNDKGPVQQNDLILKKGESAFAFITLIIPSSETLPTNLQNRIFFVTLNAEKTVANLDSSAYEVQVGTDKPVVIGLPLRGANWVAAGALSSESYHRRSVLSFNGQFYLAQRYAVDWEQVCSDGRALHGDMKDNNNWNAYGQDVISATDGTVTKVHQGVLENTPPKLPMPHVKTEDIPGNYVLIKTHQNDRDYYILYAHMQSDSIQVHEGDQVTKGQVLGMVGNSGNSSAPHLHLHVIDTNDPLKSDGVPFVFESVDLAATVKPINLDYGIWKTIIKKNESLSKNIAPLENQLFDFSKEKRFKCP